MDTRSTVRLDSTSAIVSFRVRWFGVITVRGRFESVTGSVTAPANGDEDLAVTIEAVSSSLHTGIGLRDRHLRGPRFLGAERHPVIRFESDRVRRHNGVWELHGELSLRGQPREVSASVVEQPSWGGNRRLTAEFTVPRRPHGIGAASGIRRLNPLLWAIGDEVSVRVDLIVPATILLRAAEHAPAR
jgi:polyisoprenoid-binding protein YceI